MKMKESDFKRKTNLIPLTSGGINEGLNEGLKSLLGYVTDNPGSNAIMIAGKFGKSLKTVERWIKILRNKNQIEFRGSRKTGGYFIREEKIESGKAPIKN